MNDSIDLKKKLFTNTSAYPNSNNMLLMLNTQFDIVVVV